MGGRIHAALDQLEGLEVKNIMAAPSYFDLTRWRRTPPPGATPNTLGERLRARRLELGLSQTQAGKRLGVGRTTVYR